MANLQFPDPNVENPWTSDSGVVYHHDGDKWNAESGASGGGGGLEEWTPNLVGEILAIDSGEALGEFNTSVEVNENDTVITPSSIYETHVSATTTLTARMGGGITAVYYNYTLPNSISASGSISLIGLYNDSQSPNIGIHVLTLETENSGNDFYFTADEQAQVTPTYSRSDIENSEWASTYEVISPSEFKAEVYKDGVKVGEYTKDYSGSIIEAYDYYVVPMLRVNSTDNIEGFELTQNRAPTYPITGTSMPRVKDTYVIDPTSYPSGREDKAYIISDVDTITSGKAISSEIGDLFEGSIATFDTSGNMSTRTAEGDGVDHSAPLIVDTDLQLGGTGLSSAIGEMSLVYNKPALFGNLYSGYGGSQSYMYAFKGNDVSVEDLKTIDPSESKSIYDYDVLGDLGQGGATGYAKVISYNGSTGRVLYSNRLISSSTIGDNGDGLEVILGEGIRNNTPEIDLRSDFVNLNGQSMTGNHNGSFATTITEHSVNSHYTFNTHPDYVSNGDMRIRGEEVSTIDINGVNCTLTFNNTPLSNADIEVILGSAVSQNSGSVLSLTFQHSTGNVFTATAGSNSSDFLEAVGAIYAESTENNLVVRFPEEFNGVLTNNNGTLSWEEQVLTSDDINFSSMKEGTIAAPPTGLVVGELWSDISGGETDHPIVRVARTTT